MTLTEAWSWLESFTNLEKVPDQTKRTWRLDRMQALMNLRGHPQRTERGFHLAGSKGKGSTAAFLASILEAGGWTTGLYTSPHVRDWRERITQAGRLFPTPAYTQAVSALQDFWQGLPPATLANFLEAWGGPPSTFEWLTLAAFEIFRDQALTARVLETGLGGRLDATNAQTPLACVLTLIELEHTEILGSTLVEIAGEKAGILKPEVPAFCGPQKLEVLRVFRERASHVGAPLWVFDEQIEDLETTLSRDGTRLQITFADGAGLEAQLPVLGAVQGTNAALAALTIRTLVREGYLEWPQSRSLEADLRQGLETVKLQARMQMVSRDPWLVVDGAHTEESIRQVALSWSALFGPSGTLIFGTFSGKASAAMATRLVGSFRRVVITPPGFYRPSDPAGLRQDFLAAGWSEAEVVVAENPAQALALARDWAPTQPILACGSFYLAGEILAAWEALSLPGA